MAFSGDRSHLAGSESALPNVSPQHLSYLHTLVFLWLVLLVLV